MTNAAKGTLLAAVNTILGLLDAFGIHASASTNGVILLVANAALGAVIFGTRRLSPKWQSEINTVTADAAKAVTDAAPVVEEVVKAAAKKKAVKTTPDAK